jgi:uncharacterized protein YyaL (SSP411 family)
MQDHKHTNSLIHENSPYLLQHAHNPVNWNAWNQEVLDKAKAENKLLLISVGYSACHWCHVMEHESFEDEQVAALMNEHFINIKIDREERPDIDQVYMSAVQLMTGQGGWPLNCIALPDGRPVYGGTYFPKDRWVQVLSNIADIFQKDYPKMEKYAIELTKGMLHAEQLFAQQEEKDLQLSTLEKSVAKWRKMFDSEEGGMARAPKFPLPNNYMFLLHYGTLAKDEELLKHTHFTLQKMAFGGIYDQLGGGFARYSVDAEWKVPHFEKMLYDNAQLISLYSNAYRQSKSELYKKIVLETIVFIDRELRHPEGYLYSALDADSEGVEGKFYVWTKEEIGHLLDERSATIFSDFYNVNQTGYWEGDQYILLRKETEKEFCLKHQLKEEELTALLSDAKNKLMAVRDKRIRPGLDDKTLCSWNALMITAYCEAYKAFSIPSYKEKAEQLANFIDERLEENGRLLHSYKGGVAKINGFLEDYAFVTEACLSLFEISADERWLVKANSIAEYCIQHFSDPVSGYFYFTSDEDEGLVVRKMEISDNVIPASNSQMARNLFRLHNYLHVPEYLERAKKMCVGLQDEIMHYGSGYSNWAILQCELLFPFREVAIAGEKAKELFTKMNEAYLPNTLFVYGNESSDLPLLKGRFVNDKTLIYVCENNACKLPVESIPEAMEILQK